MNKNNTQTVSLLSEAIVAVMADDRGKATQLVAQALQTLTVVTTRHKAIAAPRVAKATAGKRGRRLMLNDKQVTILNARAESGESIASLSRAFGISYPTAVRYYNRALEAATSPTK